MAVFIEWQTFKVTRLMANDTAKKQLHIRVNRTVNNELMSFQCLLKPPGNNYTVNKLTHFRNVSALDESFSRWWCNPLFCLLNRYGCMATTVSVFSYICDLVFVICLVLFVYPADVSHSDESCSLVQLFCDPCCSSWRLFVDCHKQESFQPYL